MNENANIDRAIRLNVIAGGLMLAISVVSGRSNWFRAAVRGNGNQPWAQQ